MSRHHFSDIIIAEGAMQEVATEDGLGYYPDLEIVATVNGKTFIHPHFFDGDEDAQHEARKLLDEIKKAGDINLDIWKEYKDPEYSYSKGNSEPYDAEEEHYLGVR